MSRWLAIGAMIQASAANFMALDTVPAVITRVICATEHIKPTPVAAQPLGFQCIGKARRECDAAGFITTPTQCQGAACQSANVAARQLAGTSSWMQARIVQYLRAQVVTIAGEKLLVQVQRSKLLADKIRLA